MKLLYFKNLISSSYSVFLIDKSEKLLNVIKIVSSFKIIINIEKIIIVSNIVSFAFLSIVNMYIMTIMIYV